MKRLLPLLLFALVPIAAFAAAASGVAPWAYSGTPSAGQVWVFQAGGFWQNAAVPSAPPSWSGLTTNGLLQATSSTTVASTLTPAGLTSLGFAGGGGIGGSGGAVTVTATGSGKVSLVNNLAASDAATLNNGSVSGYSTLAFLDNTGTNQGAVGWSNASAGTAPASLLVFAAVGPVKIYSGAGLAATFSASDQSATFAYNVKAAGGLVSSTALGAMTGVPGANLTVIDNGGSSTARMISYGADASTNGLFSWISRRSDGSNQLTPMTLTSAGALTTAGAIDAGSTVTSGANFNGPATARFQFNSRGGLESVADGVFMFRNSAQSAGGAFDITTGGTWKFRNTANSADAAITASTATLSGNALVTGYIQAGGTQQILWNGRGTLSSPAAGQLKIGNGNHTVGALIDVVTADTVKIRNFADNADGALTAGLGGFSDNISTSAVGKTLLIKSGANSKAGTFTLSSGTVTVSNTSVTANSVVCCTVKTASGTLGTGSPEIVITASTGFTATGIATDNSTYNFVVLEVN